MKNAKSVKNVGTRPGIGIFKTAVLWLAVVLAGAAVAQTGMIHINKLQKRGDVYYNPATNAPYTGEVDLAECEGCDIVASVSMRNGRFHGKYRGCDEDGCDEGNYRDGKKHGEWVSSSGWEGGLGGIQNYKDDKIIEMWVSDTAGWKLVDGEGNPAASNGTSYSSEDGVLYNKSKTVLVNYPAGRQSESWTIPNSVTTIGRNAFSCGDMGSGMSCRTASSITIGGGIRDIKALEQIFFYGAIASIDVAPGNANYSSADGVLFNKNKTVLVRYPAGKPDTSYAVPTGVVSIGKKAFFGCEKLTSFSVSSGVASIGDSAFFGCAGLASIDVAAGNANYSSADGVLFNKGKTRLILYPVGRQGGYRIPGGVTAIPSGAFLGCAGLASIIIPGSVASIGDRAFSGCAGLASVIIPSGVASIGQEAFFECSGLTSVISLSAAPPKIGGSGAFEGIDKTCLYVPQSGVQAYRKAAHWKNFACVNALMESDTATAGDARRWDIGKSGTKVTAVLGGGSLTIRGAGEMTAYGYNEKAPWHNFKSSVNTVIIMDSVTSIGTGALSNCTSLTSVSIPKSMARVEYSAFSGCNNLTKINITDGNPKYSSVDGVLFNKAKDSLLLCPAGKDGEYSIPNGVRIIRDGAFKDCKKLTSVTVPNGVTSIGKEAFSGCTGLTSITIPNSVTYIGKEAFSGCAGLETINVAAGHPRYSVVGGVLYNKTRDTVMFYAGGKAAVSIPGSVTTIEDGAFSGRSSLKTVIIPGSVTRIGKNAFSGSGLTSVTVFGNIASIGDFAFSGCKNLKSVTIKNPTPPTISAYAFLGLNTAACTLYVPQGGAYAAATGWNGFKHICDVDSDGKVLRVGCR